MASVLRSAVGRVASALSQTVAVTSRCLRLQPARSLTHCMPSQCGATPVPYFTAATRTSPLSSGWLARSPLLTAAHKLAPTCITQTRCYHVRVALKKRCSSCYFVRRKGRLFVECKAKPRHKQMQVMSKWKTWKEDYSQGDIKKAIYWKFKNEKRYYKLGDNEYARHDWLKGKIGVTV